LIFSLLPFFPVAPFPNPLGTNKGNASFVNSVVTNFYQASEVLLSEDFAFWGILAIPQGSAFGSAPYPISNC
jgi:hypothetical protein